MLHKLDKLRGVVSHGLIKIRSKPSPAPCRNPRLPVLKAAELEAQPRNTIPGVCLGDAGPKYEAGSQLANAMVSPSRLHVGIQVSSFKGDAAEIFVRRIVLVVRRMRRRSRPQVVERKSWCGSVAAS